MPIDTTKMNVRWILVAFVLPMSSCDVSSRKDAKANTVYASDLSARGIEVLSEVKVGMEVDELISALGSPMWVRDELSESHAFYDGVTLRTLNFTHGQWRFWYSGQKDPSFDYVRVTVVVEDGQVTEFENEWYRE